MQNEFKCPLCCSETFETRDALRYHLLSMSVNLCCPACNMLCENGLSQLVEHLANECGIELKVNIKQEALSVSRNASTGASPTPEQVSADDSSQTETIEKFIENDQVEMTLDDENGDVEMLEESLNDSTMLTLNDGSQIMVTTMEAEENLERNKAECGEIILEEGGDEEIYSCSSCGVNFTSIMEHIQQFHDGQEVVVEMADGNEEEEETIVTQEEYDDQKATSNLIEESLKSDIVQSDYFDEEIIDSTDSEEVDGETKYPQILNTLRQEECVDKDGRVYTRKVVQIEKFWDDKNIASKETSPVCEFFIINEDGSMKKLDKNDAPVEENNDDKVIKFYSCQRCQTQFSKLAQYKNHTCDRSKTEFKCQLCDSSYNNPKSLFAHMKVHKMAKLNNESPQLAPFLCVKCDTVFPSNKSLRLHQRMHEPIKSKEIEAPVEYGITGPMDFDPNKPREMFICPVCNKTYDKGYEAIHMATHNGGVDYHCDICNRKFYTHDNLEMHMRVHNGGKPYSCSYCKNSFESQEALTIHMDVHTKHRPYQCGYCGRKFSRPHEKVKHERIHTGEKPHECEICGKTFRVSYCLTLHMRTHTGARPYVCKHCGKRFKAHSVYNHHLLTHSDQRNYKCPFCPKAFKTGVQLAGHKNSHTKPFSCTECNRPFASLYAVRSHMESHKRENNLKFRCYLCGASYARNFALRDHIKEVHNTIPTLGDSADPLTEVIANENGIIMTGKRVKIETLENFKASNAILAEEDETEIALSQLQAEETDEEL